MATSSTNPSHILIARTSRTPATAALSSPTETPAVASGIFPRSSSSPPWLLETDEVDPDEFLLDENGLGKEGDVEVDETFLGVGRWPGTVKIVVENTTFWAHKDILVFASPFFEAALSGNWAETRTGTGRPSSMSSVITISQPPTVPGSTGIPQSSTPEMSFAPFSSDDDSEDRDLFTLSESEPDEETKEKARTGSLEKLQGGKKNAEEKKDKEKEKEEGDKVGLPSKRWKKRGGRVAEAIIVLKEERATTFQDFLRFVYPHLDCTIAWNNVEGLMNISHKLCVPSLQSSCLNFLLTHAAGKPIKAMRIAELFGEEELYRESSRFVLDNPGGWPDAELQTLSPETLLKLEKRRNWFLERVLKLGLISIAKEYQCCPTCPDPSNCARLLEDKWRQGYHALFRFGPAQPSMVYRYLRSLEGVSPPLSLTHLACQTTAKAWTATLFDRMFSLGVRGSGTDTIPLGARVAGAASGPRRHFLYCSLKPEPPVRGKTKSVSGISGSFLGSTVV